MTTDDRPILVVGGLAAEARIAAGPGVVAVAAPPAALASKLAQLDVEPVAAISFGLCGGLAPSLPAGSLAIGTMAIRGGRAWACDRALSARFVGAAADAGFASIDGAIACSDAPVLARSDKAALHERTKAVAVDTESHVVAAYAAARGIPFAVLRTVSDPADKDLPPLAIRAIGPDGGLDWRAIGSELAGRPAQLLRLPGTALGTWAALRTLSRVRRRLGPRFGL